MPMKLAKNGHLITTVQDWFDHAPPKRGIKQWVDGRSAKEIANSFFENSEPQLPVELAHLLSSHPDLGTVEIESATPEHKIRLDNFKGETRNADLVAWGTCAVGKVAVTIEAKADESFGTTIGEALATKKPGSNAPKRADALSKAIFGKPARLVAELRYQLLYGAAATLIYAKEVGAKAAIFAVWEYCGSSCTRENLDRNARDFASFIQGLSHERATIENRLLGPLRIPGGGFVPSDIPLFLGKTGRKDTQS